MADQHRAPLILIVDDDPLTRIDLSDTLVEAGYRTVQAASAEEASAKVDAQKPGLMITDIYMDGGGDGLGLIRRVHARDPNLKIIAMSGHDHRRYEVLDRAEQIGADGALGKPIQHFELLDLVARLAPQGA
jgi:DNA-binding NtrC family response regulator